MLPAPGILAWWVLSFAVCRETPDQNHPNFCQAQWWSVHSHAGGPQREGPLYGPREASRCQQRPGTGAQLSHSCSNRTNCPRDKTIALVWLVRAWHEPDTFFSVKAFCLEVNYRNKVPLTPSLSRLLPGKDNLFFLKRRALKEMLPRRARSHCIWLSLPPVKKAALNFLYTVMGIEVSTPTSSLKNPKGAAQGLFSWSHLCSPSNGTVSVMEIIPGPMWARFSGSCLWPVHLMVHKPWRKIVIAQARSRTHTHR